MNNLTIPLPSFLKSAAMCGILSLMMVGASPGWGAEVTLTSSKDNTLFENGADLSNGAGDFLFVGRTGEDSNQIRRALIAFDIAAGLPAGAVISAATLTLNMSKAPNSTNRNVSLHRASQTWGEGRSSASKGEGEGTRAQAGDATWTKSIFPDTPWSKPGGDFESTATATIPVGGTKKYSWSGAGVVADLQNWLDNPATNFGWFLIGDESTSRSAKRFDTHEIAATRNRPELKITFELPKLPGDFNADNQRTVADIDLLCTGMLAASDFQFDMNQDGLLNVSDLTFWVESVRKSHMGDVDLDGEVSFTDFLALSQAFGQAGRWSQGDMDCNGQIEFADFLTLSANFGKQQGVAATVPEPTSPLALLFTAGWLGVRRRHRA